MEIKDIKFMNGEAYVLKKIDMDINQCVNEIKNIKYTDFYNGYRSEKDEMTENTQFPPIIYAFYLFIFNNNHIPTPQQLIDNYFKINSDVFRNMQGDRLEYKSQKYNIKSVIGRILRTYPSLIRDFHFYNLLVAENCFDKVIYSCLTDIGGKDIIIRHKGKEYEISLYVETKRSNFFKAIKNKFRHNYTNEIKLPIKLEEKRKCGDFYLYNKNDIEIIKLKLNKECN